VTKRHLGNEVTFYFVSLLGFDPVLVVTFYTSINLDVCSDLCRLPRGPLEKVS